MKAASWFVLCHPKLPLLASVLSLPHTHTNIHKHIQLLKKRNLLQHQNKAKQVSNRMSRNKAAKEYMWKLKLIPLLKQATTSQAHLQ
jgi:hypothetical protein